jgi:hypothetical protein
MSDYDRREGQLPYGPTPGSPEALAQGCLCPVIDNHRGKGFPGEDGPNFWITGGCPLHDTERHTP